MIEPRASLFKRRIVPAALAMTDLLPQLPKSRRWPKWEFRGWSYAKSVTPRHGALGGYRPGPGAWRPVAGGIIHAVVETPVARPHRATVAALGLVMVGVGLVSCVSNAPQRTVYRGVEIDGPSNSKRLSVRARPSMRVLSVPSR